MRFVDLSWPTGLTQMVNHQFNLLGDILCLLTGRLNASLWPLARVPLVATSASLSMAAEATDNAKYLETYGITELINRPPDRGNILSEADDTKTSSRHALLATPQHSDTPSHALRENHNF